MLRVWRLGVQDLLLLRKVQGSLLMIRHSFAPEVADDRHRIAVRVRATADPRKLVAQAPQKIGPRDCKGHAHDGAQKALAVMPAIEREEVLEVRVLKVLGVCDVRCWGIEV